MGGPLGNGMAQDAHDALSSRAERLTQQECAAGIKTEVECSAAFEKYAAKPTPEEQEFLKAFENNRELQSQGVYASHADVEASALSPELLEKIDDLGENRHPAVEQALQEVINDPASFGVEVENTFLGGDHDFESQGYVSSPMQP